MLLLLYIYSTNGTSWDGNTEWMSDFDECGWYNEGEGCKDGVLVGLDLWFNNLVGTIPNELALLSTFE